MTYLYIGGVFRLILTLTFSDFTDIIESQGQEKSETTAEGGKK